MNISLQFATPIGSFNIDKTMCDEFSQKIHPLLIASDDVAEHTADALNTIEEFSPLVNIIDYCVEQYSLEAIGVDKNDLRLTGMWANAHSSGSLHQIHQHPNSFISGVLYLQIPECEHEGELIFVDPRPAKNMTFADFKKDTCMSNRTIKVTPHTGLLLLFPSWLEHGTSTFLTKTREKRISLSFNYFLNSCSYRTMKI
jgi:uncharacterized protein (TIGR02466 family)